MPNITAPHFGYMRDYRTADSSNPGRRFVGSQPKPDTAPPSGSWNPTSGPSASRGGAIADSVDPALSAEIARRAATTNGEATLLDTLQQMRSGNEPLEFRSESGIRAAIRIDGETLTLRTSGADTTIPFPLDTTAQEGKVSSKRSKRSGKLLRSWVNLQGANSIDFKSFSAKFEQDGSFNLTITPSHPNQSEINIKLEAAHTREARQKGEALDTFLSAANEQKSLFTDPASGGRGITKAELKRAIKAVSPEAQPEVNKFMMSAIKKHSDDLTFSPLSLRSTQLLGEAIGLDLKKS